MHGVRCGDLQRRNNTGSQVVFLTKGGSAALHRQLDEAKQMGEMSCSDAKASFKNICGGYYLVDLILLSNTFVFTTKKS
jgi:hypothetical protein